MDAARLPTHARQLLGRVLTNGAPRFAVYLAIACYLAQLVGEPIDGAELFAGQRAVTNGLRFLGFTVFPFEIKDASDSSRDILSPQGFALALSCVLRIAPGGILWVGVVCSSWVFMCRHTTGRTHIDILGNEDREGVLLANRMVSRVLLLVRLAVSLGIIVLLEQPLSSIMYLHPRFQAWLDECAVFSCVLSLGYFGGETQKTVKLWSNCDCIQQLASARVRRWLPRSVSTFKSYQNELGESKVDGGEGLKQSETYPVLFGAAVAFMYKDNHACLRDRALELQSATSHHEQLILDPTTFQGMDWWPDGDFAPVLDLLMEVAAARLHRVSKKNVSTPTRVLSRTSKLCVTCNLMYSLN